MKSKEKRTASADECRLQIAVETLGKSTKVFKSRSKQQRLVMILKGRNTSPNTLWTQLWNVGDYLSVAISNAELCRTCAPDVTNFVSRHKDSLVGSMVCCTDWDLLEIDSDKDLRDQKRPHKPHISHWKCHFQGTIGCTPNSVPMVLIGLIYVGILGDSNP